MRLINVLTAIAILAIIGVVIWQASMARATREAVAPETASLPPTVSLDVAIDQGGGFLEVPTRTPNGQLAGQFRYLVPGRLNEVSGLSLQGLGVSLKASGQHLKHGEFEFVEITTEPPYTLIIFKAPKNDAPKRVATIPR